MDWTRCPLPGGQALLNGPEDFFIGRKSQRCLLRGQVLANPDRKFAASAFKQLRFEAGFVLDERRRTGGSGVIVSNLAVADANAGHRFLLGIESIREDGGLALALHELVD